jgi:hypothetical protein
MHTDWSNTILCEVLGFFKHIIDQCDGMFGHDIEQQGLLLLKVMAVCALK